MLIKVNTFIEVGRWIDYVQVKVESNLTKELKVGVILSKFNRDEHWLNFQYKNSQNSILIARRSIMIQITILTN